MSALSESDASSADDYVSESDSPKAKEKGPTKKSRRISVSSDDSDDSNGSEQKRSRARAAKPPKKVQKSSESPTPSSPLKRRVSHAEALPSKRKRSIDSSSSDDPARIYCRGKLQEVFIQIFTKYPHVPDAGDPSKRVERANEDLTEDEKAALRADAETFASDLEQCVWDVYAEPDKQGKPHVGGKYKERFRMLQFNLSKSDRVVLHKRISSLDIAPKEISLMSSADLANEEQKKNMQLAEKEALEQSILQKTVAPRAKVTHKGLQDIEDVSGVEIGSREREREQQDDEERRERERMARVRAAQQQRKSSLAASPPGDGTAPPTSPVVTSPTSQSWGAPPPLPSHSLGHDADALQNGQPSMSSVLETAPAEFVPSEPELNLADLINIDEDQGMSHSPGTPMAMSPPTSTHSPASPAAPTGISPFATNAAKPDMRERSSSFDLNAFWSESKVDEARGDAQHTDTQAGDSGKDVLMEDVAEDQDFDMFLEKEGDDGAQEPEMTQELFDQQGQVWSGKLGMPLDSTMPQETPVVARGIGGRTIEADSPLWKTLFPSDIVRIDGRVPTKSSHDFLLTTRMNAAKELVAVAFSPGSEQSQSTFNTLADYLIRKDRHGLVFPWGNRPKEHHPGRELYIIPLLASEPLPEIIELLDDLRFPKVRTSHYMVGIWVLNKGKLAPPPADTTTPPAAPRVPAAPPTPAAYPPAIPATAPASNVVPAHLAGLSPEALAARVASMSPEQIQMMLQSLSVPGAAQPGVFPVQNAGSPPQPAYGVSLPAAPYPQSSPPQPANGPPPFAGNAWQPPQQSYGQPMSVPPPQGYRTPIPPRGSPPHDPYYDQTYDRSSRGWHNRDDDYGRGSPRGRGRGRGGDGRGRGRGRDFDQNRRHSDSGWSRRGGNAERGGGRGRW